MGGMATKSPPAPIFYSELFERVCPYYISFGMTYEQFWDGPPEMARDYRKAHEIKTDEMNHFAWLQGAYVYRAISALAPALKAFAKGRAGDYLKKPFGYEEKAAPKPVREKKSDNQAREWLEMWAINFNAKFDKEKNTTEGGGVDG